MKHLSEKSDGCFFHVLMPRRGGFTSLWESSRKTGDPSSVKIREIDRSGVLRFRRKTNAHEKPRFMRYFSCVFACSDKALDRKVENQNQIIAVKNIISGLKRRSPFLLSYFEFFQNRGWFCCAMGRRRQMKEPDIFWPPLQKKYREGRKSKLDRDKNFRCARKDKSFFDSL